MSDRLSGHWAPDVPAVVRVESPADSAFVLLPCSMLTGQWVHVQFLYRVAFEQAQAQVAQERRTWRLAVSLK